jgi:hypothetical protein
MQWARTIAGFASAALFLFTAAAAGHAARAQATPGGPALTISQQAKSTHQRTA